MIRRPPRSTLDRSSAASDVYKRQAEDVAAVAEPVAHAVERVGDRARRVGGLHEPVERLSLIHISEPTRPY